MGSLPSQQASDRAAERRRALLGWYRAEARDLPWRRTRDPYAIWISEAMLQQTRVETVVPYWERFLERLPDIAALAAAEEDEVLALWSGLGYYRRARALQAAARAIVATHGGRFPETRAEALALPGVGAYTAGAVLSIAFDAPEPTVDGNIERVLCRWFEIDLEHGSTALRDRLWALAAELVPARGAGAWNQALMELGATLCRPRDPNCAACPVQHVCGARRAGRTATLPRPRVRAAPVLVELVALQVQRRGRVLMERQPDGGRMAGLWQHPVRELGVGAAPPTGLFPARWSHDRLTAGPEQARVRHTITKHRIAVSLRLGSLPGGARVRTPLAWIDESALADLPLTGLARKLLAARQR